MWPQEEGLPRWCSGTSHLVQCAWSVWPPGSRGLGSTPGSGGLSVHAGQLSAYSSINISGRHSTHSLTAALDQLRVIASSTLNDPGPRSRQHQQIGTDLSFQVCISACVLLNLWQATWTGFKCARTSSVSLTQMQRTGLARKIIGTSPSISHPCSFCLAHYTHPLPANKWQ